MLTKDKLKQERKDAFYKVWVELKNGRRIFVYLDSGGIKNFLYYSNCILKNGPFKIPKYEILNIQICLHRKYEYEEIKHDVFWVEVE